MGEVQQLKKKYGTPLTSIELKKEGEFSPDSVASLLKRFFFELPNPLIDFGSFDKMLDAHGEFVDDEDEVFFLFFVFFCFCFFVLTYTLFLRKNLKKN